MTYSLGASSRRNLATVKAPMQRVVELAITLTDQDFTVFAGNRSAAEQNALYQKGRTIPGDIVTDKDGYKNKSNHQGGNSVDLVAWVNGRPSWASWDAYYVIASAMAQASARLGVPIKWGGNWYDRMDEYGGTSVQDMKDAVERYKHQHPGKDFIDGPHFELVT